MAPVDHATDIEVPLADHLTGVHVVHYVGVDGKDIRVCVCFNADDECSVTVATAPGMYATVGTIEYAGEAGH